MSPGYGHFFNSKGLIWGKFNSQRWSLKGYRYNMKFHRHKEVEEEMYIIQSLIGEVDLKHQSLEGLLKCAYDQPGV